MSLKVEFKSSGPIADGTAYDLVNQGLHNGLKQTADRALTLLRDQFHVTFRAPTGRYESHVHVVPLGNNFKVTDDGVIYGPWLEGIGSKNPVTRFKGYWNFKKVATIVDSSIVEVTRHEIALKLGT